MHRETLHLINNIYNKYMVSIILGNYSVVRDETKALVVQVLEMCEPGVKGRRQ